jgi:hypothetical protein
LRTASGEIIALGGGVYRRADAPPADDDLIEIAERVPAATICLESALARHHLIDAVPAADRPRSSGFLAVLAGEGCAG